jgi:hypothetical protein
MSLGNWGENLLRGAAGAFFGSDYLRDYTHAARTFRTNSYENAPKFKFLFHTYFDINPEAYDVQLNFGLLVKEVKLPSFNIQTHQLNQYNRKRITQTKIRYDPIEITFHDDNGNNINKLWEAYYRYYYNDGSKPSNVLRAQRGRENFPAPIDGDITSPIPDYNYRDMYQDSYSRNYDWGFNGGNNISNADTGIKVPFFKNITVFGLNQHQFTAYTLINPMITNFSHDTYSYNEGNGIMQNRMTIDYETVVYNAGELDGRNPEDIVTGFGDPANYDRSISPIAMPGANGTVLGRGGLIDAAGGAVRALQEGNILGAVLNAGAVYNGVKNPNLIQNTGILLDTVIREALSNTPSNRNSIFSIPGINQTPGTAGLAGSPTVGARQQPQTISDEPTAGTQSNGGPASEGFPVEAPFGGNFNSGPSNITFV